MGRYPERFRTGLWRLAAAGLLGMTVVAFPAAAAFPEREVQLIVPWPAGGGTDIVSRLVAQYAERYLGVPIVVVNRPGAAGAIGTREIARARPDGYTIGVVANAALASQYMVPDHPDMSGVRPVVIIGGESATLTARADAPWRSVADFVQAAKAGRIRVATDPPGGGSFIAAVVMERGLGIQTTKVPYQGFAPSVAALQAGEVQATTVPVPDVIAVHRSGQARILGVMESQRHFLAPDVPTFQEQGYDVVYSLWRAVIAPRDVPADRLAVLERAFLQALNDPDLKQRAQEAGFTIGPLSAEQAARRWQQDDQAAREILQELGMLAAPRRR